MMAGKASTVPAVKAYLLDRCTRAVAALNLSEPDVSVVLSGIEEPENIDDFVTIGREIVRTTEANRIVGGGGLHWMRERYTVSIGVQCVQHFSEDFTEVDRRAYLLLDAVEQVVRADPSMSGLVIVSQPGRATADSSYEPDHSGAMTVIESVIDVHAEL